MEPSSNKRKHEEKICSHSFHASGVNPGDTLSAPARSETVKAALFGACRAALRFPVTARAALAKHKASIDPELADLLGTVGSYSDDNGRTSLHTAVISGEVSIVKSLIAAGAYVGAEDRDVGATPLDLTTDEACREILEHHNTVLAALKDDPAALALPVAAHRTALASPNAPPPAETALSLRAYQLDPSFLWAPDEARTAIFAWARAWTRDAAAVQLAPTIRHFDELPDDCACDVFEYLVTVMPRADVHQMMEHSSSPESQEWVRAIVAAEVAVNATIKLLVDCPIEEGDLACVLDCLQKGADVNVRTF